VTQPKLGSTVMTALHRRWPESGDATARDEIARPEPAALPVHGHRRRRAAGLAHWQTGLNANRLLASEWEPRAV